MSPFFAMPVHALLLLLAPYRHPRILTVGIFGLCSGLPVPLILGTLTFWLAESGIEKSAIGLFAALGTPYIFKFAWAPIVDHVPIPFLSQRLGRRRAWIFLTQTLLILLLVALGFQSPQEDLGLIALLAFGIALFSATQDIAIDAYRIERVPEQDQAAAAAASVFGWRMGALISGAGALLAVDALGWQGAYLLMAATLGIGILTTLLLRDKPQALPLHAPHFRAWCQQAVVAPFAVFMQRTHWVWLLWLIILYKLGDAMIGTMTSPLMVELGFSRNEVALITKSYGLIATLFGAFLGGVLAHRYGLFTNLVLACLLQMGSNALFVWLAHSGHDVTVLTLTITGENIAGGLGTAIFVAFLSRLCDREYTATHYALFSALASIGRTWLPTPAGYIVEAVDWAAFFLISMAVALPGLMLLIALRRVIRSL